MEQLEGIKMQTVQVKTYDGENMEALVIKRPNDVQRGPQLDSLPTERYLDIIVEGCRHYGVRKDWINYIRGMDK
jgi:hypothetical protein